MTQAALEQSAGNVVDLKARRAVPDTKRPARRRARKAVVHMTAAEKRTAGQVIAAMAASFLPVASYVLAHYESKTTPLMWTLVAAALMFSAPTLIDWAQRWCKSRSKAVGFTALLEGVMVFSANEYLALSGLAILVAINAHSAWQLAGGRVMQAKGG